MVERKWSLGCFADGVFVHLLFAGGVSVLIVVDISLSNLHMGVCGYFQYFHFLVGCDS